MSFLKVFVLITLTSSTSFALRDSGQKITYGIYQCAPTDGAQEPIINFKFYYERSYTTGSYIGGNFLDMTLTYSNGFQTYWEQYDGGKFLGPKYLERFVKVLGEVREKEDHSIYRIDTRYALQFEMPLWSASVALDPKTPRIPEDKVVFKPILKVPFHNRKTTFNCESKGLEIVPLMVY